MSRKCDWCGKYHEERFNYDYYRNNNGVYRSYNFCSTACKFYFKENTDLTQVDNNGYTPKEAAIESRRRNQEIKDKYGSWENYQNTQKQIKRDKEIKSVLTSLFIWLVCPFILILLYKNDFISFFKLFVFGFVWLAVALNYSENN